MDSEWFRARKKELRLTDQHVAAAIGRDRSVANRLLAGKVTMDLSYVPALAQIFEVSRAEILRRTGTLEAELSAGSLSSNAQVFNLEGASLQEPRPNLPVFGTALGADREVRGDAIEQTTLNRAEVVEYAKRPPLLNRHPKAYGLYVQGGSMHPALPDGEMVAVVPGMPLSTGDHVVVYLRPEDPNEDDGQTARAVLVKELVRRSAAVVVLRQYDPPAQFEVAMDEVVRIDRVLTRREMLS